MAADSVVRGVTLTGGRTCDAKTEDANKSNGGACRNGGWLVDCLVTNNVACRGGALWNVKAVGCRFAGNRAVKTGSDMYNGAAYNCFFGAIAGSGYSVYTGGPFVNCTFAGSGSFGRSFGAGSFVNCIISKTDGGINKNAFVNCMINTVFTEGSTADESNTIVTAAQLNLDTDGIPLAGSVAIDTGSNDLYAAKFPTASVVSEFKAVDALGNPRIIAGTIDVGAAEFDWTKLPSTSGIDLTVSGKTIMGQPRVTPLVGIEWWGCRGGLMVDPSVRRLRRPVAGRRFFKAVRPLTAIINFGNIFPVKRGGLLWRKRSGLPVMPGSSTTISRRRLKRSLTVALLRFRSRGGFLLRTERT